MTNDEHRQALQKDLHGICEKAMKGLEALRPLHDDYLRVLDAVEMVTPDRDLGNRGTLPAGHSRQPFGAWLIELVNGLGGYRIR